MKPPLAFALRAVGMSTADVATRLQVDPKTVQRWVGGRVPYPRHRIALAELTGWAVRDLWPAATRPTVPESALDEVRIVYPHRSTVPLDTWRRLFGRADREIGVLVYSGLFLAENTAVQGVLRDRARAGVRVRILLGDERGEQVARRGTDEGIGEIMSARIRNALILFRPLTSESGVELRIHDTALYNSIYRADDDLLVNVHVHGCPASFAPVLHIRRTTDNGMAASYIDSFERAWTSARVSDL